MSNGSASKKVLASVAAGSMLMVGCGGAAASDESAPAQVRQTVRSSAPLKLSTGRFHNVTLKADGSVWAWGRNAEQQLGDGTTTNRYQPVQVQGLTGTFVGVMTGHIHSMALRDDGTLWAWGANANGQLGDGTSGTAKAPVQVKNLTNVVAMAGGANFSLGLESDGDVWAWGHNYYCQLGNGSYSPSSLPVRVMTADPALPYLTNVVAIAAGQYSGLAVRNDGSVWAWGNNANGRLGDGTTTERCKAVRITFPIADPTPTDPTDNVVPVDVSMGDNHSLALLSDGTVMAWGHNGLGQLGTGSSGGYPSPGQSNTPIPVLGLSNVTQLDAGPQTSLAVSNGTMFAWGQHSHGHLCLGYGGGSSASMAVVPTSPSPMQGTPVPPGISYVGAGEFFSATLATDGTLWTCGSENYSALGYDLTGLSSWSNTLATVPGFP